MAAPNPGWYNLLAHTGFMQLQAIANPTDASSLSYAGNLLLQKFTAPAFIAITRFNSSHLMVGDRAGITIMGNYYTCLYLEKTETANSLVLSESKRIDRKYQLPQELTTVLVSSSEIWLKVQVKADATCKYEYSVDGKNYQPIEAVYKIEKGTWIGAKAGMFCLNPGLVKSNGYADFDYFRVEK